MTTSKARSAYVRALEFMDSKPKLKFMAFAAGGFLVNFAFTALSYSLFLNTAVKDAGEFLALMCVSLIPAFTVMMFKRGGWKLLYRLPAILFLLLSADRMMLAVLMLACSLWLWWQLLRKDNLPWVLQRKTDEG